MFRILICLTVALGLCCGRSINAYQNDKEVVEKISAGWRTAFNASRSISTFELMIRNQPPANRDGWTQRYFIQTKGQYFVLANSVSGTERDPKAPFSFIRFFNGDYLAAISTHANVTGPYNRDSDWVMSDLVMGPNADNRTLEALRQAAEAGVYISNGMNLSFFLPESEHMSVDKVFAENESGRELIRMEWSVVQDRVDRKKHVRAIPDKGVFWLAPDKSYLPVRAELSIAGGFASRDQIEYQVNGDSFYVKKISTDLSYPSADGKGSKWLVESEVTTFSEQIPSDEVFRLSHYGLTEPEVVGKPRRISWYLIVLGLMIVVGVLVGRRFLTRRE